MMIFNENQKYFIKNFILVKNYNVKMVDNGSYLTLYNITDEMLMDILTILHLKIDIIRNNIVNVNTTRTVDGSPFLRGVIKVTIENGIEIIKIDDIKYVYDPMHPDAILQGDRKGFVQFPNIDIISEYYDLVQTIQLFNSIVNFIHNNHKHIIVDKINIITIEELKHNLNTERFRDFFIKRCIEKFLREN